MTFKIACRWSQTYEYALLEELRIVSTVMIWGIVFVVGSMTTDVSA